ncbi:hypothetical protein BVRB_8g185860 [Beta vulgaris subsp. vulgaris]|nr:hypothetical protein BVRB_8g185860 [Beta vulgaris subsp. vulgaris]
MKPQQKRTIFPPLLLSAPPSTPPVNHLCAPYNHHQSNTGAPSRLAALPQLCRASRHPFSLHSPLSLRLLWCCSFIPLVCCSTNEHRRPYVAVLLLLSRRCFTAYHRISVSPAVSSTLFAAFLAAALSLRTDERRLLPAMPPPCRFSEAPPRSFIRFRRSSELSCRSFSSLLE